MRNALIAIVAAMAIISLTGCGTTCNLAGGFKHPDDEPKIYGGVQRDLDFVAQLSPDKPRGDRRSERFQSGFATGKTAEALAEIFGVRPAFASTVPSLRLPSSTAFFDSPFDSPDNAA